MRVAIFGTGYVGLVTGTCLADVGHQVVCVDIDQAKVDGLNRGVIPIYEPGLEPMVKANHAASRLAFTTDAASAITHGQVIFIAVGTPPDEDGSADLQYVLAVARTIGTHMAVPTVVVNKSTVPVGTADKGRAPPARGLGGRARGGGKRSRRGGGARPTRCVPPLPRCWRRVGWRSRSMWSPTRNS